MRTTPGFGWLTRHSRNGIPPKTKRPLVTYARFDVVLVLFPFTEKLGRKQRPAVVLSGTSFNAVHEHALCAMVTTASNTRWPSDVAIEAFGEAGLRSPSFARLKLFTVAYDAIPGRLGTLDLSDQRSLDAAIRKLMLE
jgi:mRNA interferase MazF